MALHFIKYYCFTAKQNRKGENLYLKKKLDPSAILMQVPSHPHRSDTELAIPKFAKNKKEPSNKPFSNSNLVKKLKNKVLQYSIRFAEKWYFVMWYYCSSSD